MLAKAIVRAIMNEKGIGPLKLAEMLGFDYPQKVTDRLGTGKSAGMGTDKLDEMVRALGYKIVVIPTEVKVEDGWYEIDDSTQELTPEVIKKRKAERLKNASPSHDPD